MDLKVVAIIQARMDSSRLPGKVLAPIEGKPMLWHIVERARRARGVHEVVVATSTEASDDPIAVWCNQEGVPVRRGSKDDVLDRMYQAAKSHEADVVVRLTADCPLHDSAVIERFVSTFVARRDLEYLGGDPTFAEGLDTEVLSFAALERAAREATKAYEREHVTVHLWQSGKFRAERLGHQPDLSSMRWTVDEANDLEFARAVYRELAPQRGLVFGKEAILDLLASKPEIRQMNQGVIRNEGLLKSLQQERGSMVKQRSKGIAASQAWWERTQGLIPAGTQTLSKGPTQYVDGVAPKYLQRARGCRVWDVDGNEYIDYMMGLGAIILGHGYPEVNEAIRRQLDDGVSFTLMHPLEVEVAEMLRKLIPVAENVRFAKNGSDATTGAIRAARAHTGRDLVAHCGYHGWHDWYIGSTTRNKGVPKAAIQQQKGFQFNDLASLERIFQQHPDDVAAVIMEPYVATLPAPGFLEGVKKLAGAHGALLIFDEVASGFRFHRGGIHQRLGVEPDLACFGKAMANGMPLAALVGKAEYMEAFEDVFMSFTFGGEALSLAACKATLQVMEREPVIEHLWQQGTRLQEGFNRLASDLDVKHVVQSTALPPRNFVSFQAVGSTPSLVVKSLFQQEAIKRGVLLGTGHLMTYSHREQDVEYTLGAYQEVMEIFRAALREGTIEKRLEGKPVQPVFRPID